MDKKMLIIAFFAFLILALLFFGFIAWRAYPTNSTNQSRCPSNNSMEIHTKFSAFSEGQPLPSVDWCYCYENYSEDKNYNEAMDLCFSVMGGYGTNSSVCMMVNHTYYKDTCLSGVASNTHNTSICGLIEEQVVRERCYNNVK
jgi:capsule polysaccharide export protein KpsE/RkpR